MFQQCYAGEKKTAMSQEEKWQKLLNLIENEVSTIKKNKYSSVELDHRLFELYCEKIKILREKENLVLINSDPKLIEKAGRDSFFKNSKSLASEAQYFAFTIIKNHPKYEKINEIYYALAINARDYLESTETEGFLKFAIKYSKESDPTFYHSKTALAEFYYNNKKYVEAIDYYGDILKNKNNEWYSKHLYNASWCYLKARNFSKALELIKQSYEASNNKKYISIKDQVISAIAIFFIQADQINEGIHFFEKNTTPASPHLLSMAKSSMSKNSFNETEEILKSALKDARSNKDKNFEMKVYLTQFEIFREAKKMDQFFETANKTLELSQKYQINNEDIEQAVNKIKEVAGFMQINLVKDKLKEEISYDRENYQKIIRFFDILSILDIKNKNLYRYYQGETSLSIHNYGQALQYYTKSIIQSKKTKVNGETTKKSLDAMLSTIEYAKLDKKIENEYLIFALKNYLLFYPVSEKSQSIYQKLFSKYFDNKKIKKSINALLVYKKNYPNDEAIHREMLSQILNHYMQQKNTDNLAFWINKLEDGYLNFKKDYIENAIAVLGNLLFEKFQRLEKIGEDSKAMVGYESIFDSKKYPKKTKAQAAYAISALKVKHNDAKDSYKWLKRSFELFEKEDIKKQAAAILQLSKEYRLLQKFNISSELAGDYLKKFCHDDLENKDQFFEIAYFNLFHERNDYSKITAYEDSISDCNINQTFVEQKQLEMLTFLIFVDHEKDSINYFFKHSSNKSLLPLFSNYMKYKFWQSSEEEKKQYAKTFAELDGQNSDLKLSSIVNTHDKNRELVERITQLSFKFSSPEKFNEELYNNELEQYFNIISSLSKEALQLSKNNSTEENIFLNNSLSIPYFKLIKSIDMYQPKGVDNKYLEGFKQGMRQIIESLNAKGLQIDREKIAFLEKNHFFFEVQKYAKFENNQESTELDLQKILKNHSAKIYSSSLDISKGKKDEPKTTKNSNH
jgi:hypothetical protein